MQMFFLLSLKKLKRKFPVRHSGFFLKK